MRIIGNDPNTPRQTQVVASGTLSTGDTVVVNSDGTVSAVAETSVSDSAGSPVVFESASTDYTSAAYDINAQKVVISYRDGGNSSYGTAVVGTVSGTSISFGTPTVFESANSAYTSVTYDSGAQKVVIAYSDGGSSDHGTAIVGTVSGTSISFGNANPFEEANTSQIRSTYDANTGKVVIVYRDEANSGYGTAVVGTVSGTSITFGSPLVFQSASVGDPSPAYDANTQKIVIAYSDFSSSGYGTAIVGTVSGTSISFGSPVVYRSVNLDFSSATYDASAQKVVIAYKDNANSSYGTAIVGTVSGTSISFGSPVVFENGDSRDIRSTYDTVAQKVVIAYRNASNLNYGTVVSGTVSGTSINFGSSVVFESANSDNIGITFDESNGKSAISYRDRGNTNFGTSVVFRAAGTEANLTSENYIGTAKSGAADGDGVVVNTQGTVQTLSFDTFDMSSTTYDDKSFNVGSQEIYPNGLAFKSDGTKMYVTGPQGNDVNEYALSTAWDVSTASYTTVFSTSGQTGSPQDIFFKTDGTKMYVLDTVTQGVFQYSLSSAWDISTASYDSVSFGTSGQDTAPRGMYIKPDGTKLYIVGNTNDTVSEYNLSSAWDMSTASYSQNYSISAQEGLALGLGFAYDGTKFFVVGNTNDTVYQYSLGTAWDVSTASYSSKSFSIAGQDTQAYSIRFKPDGTKMYIGGADNTSVFQYTTQGSLTAGQSYYVQTDGTLSTTAGDPSVFAGTAVSATKLIVKG